MKLRQLPLLLVAAAVLQPLAAQQMLPDIGKDQLAQRRQELMQRLKSGVVLVRGAGTNEDMGQFVQNHECYYLTGINEPNITVLLLPETKEQLLFVPPFSRFTADWEGERVPPGKKGEEMTGFGKVLPPGQLRAELDKLLKQGDSAKPVLWTPLQPSPGRSSTPGQMLRVAGERQNDPFDGRESRESALKESLERMYPGIAVRDLTAEIHDMRGVKSKDEIACVRAAAAAGAQGIAEAMRSTEPGMYEFEVAAVARYVFDRLGANGDAYGAIVGAGKNGCVLHYMANSKRIEDGELIVMDYAPMVRNYCADVTRTFPANGKFTPEQRKLVQDIYEIQRTLVTMVKPGLRMGEIERKARQMLTERGYRSAHGVSHHVGLAVHDVGDDELRPGMVFTIEPGAYFAKQGMGCRVEDTILVTEDGYINLSEAVPASPDEIEKLMAEKGIAQQPVGTKK